MNAVIGRTEEKKILLEALQSSEPELIAIYGRRRVGKKSKVPLWVNKIKDILLSKFSEKITLDYLSRELNIHPVHLSRDFSKYFNCSLGMYIRKIKIEKALSLLSDTELSLTDISFNCGFADQSHFLRCFKDITGKRPSEYRKILFR